MNLKPTKVRFAKYSICQCGYPALGYKVSVGTVFHASLQHTCKGNWRCGGCGLVSTLKCIMVEGLGFRPEVLFEVITQEPKKKRDPQIIPAA